MRVNYTTYDVRRDQDTINPRTHADIMVLAPDEPDALVKHPYWYARVCGIYTMDVKYQEPGKPPIHKTFEVLWVRWFGRCMKNPGGWKKKRLDRVGFLPASEFGAFGFFDPALVIRGCHMIPMFSGERVDNLLPAASLMRTAAGPDGYTDGKEWEFYYVNR